MRPISLAHLTVLELPPPTAVSVAAACGYSHVGLRLCPASSDETVSTLVQDRSVLGETKRRLHDTGVEVLDVEVFRLRASTVVGRDYHPIVETAANLGARHLLAVGDDTDDGRLAENLGRLCDLACDYDMTVNLEFVSFKYIRTLAHARRLVESIGAPNCGLLLDSLHVARAGTGVAEIENARSLLLYAQLCDAPALSPGDEAELIFEARHARLAPGSGELDLRGFLRAIPQDLPLSLEVPTLALARSAPAERARSILKSTLQLLANM